MMYSCVIKCCILCVHAALNDMKIMKIVYMLLHMENSTGPELAMSQKSWTGAIYLMEKTR